MPVIHRIGNLRGAKEKYKQNVWYCIWYPLPSFDEFDNVFEETGLCFDIAEEDIDNAIELLQHLKTSDVNDYTEDNNGQSKV